MALCFWRRCFEYQLHDKSREHSWLGPIFEVMRIAAPSEPEINQLLDRRDLVNGVLRMYSDGASELNADGQLKRARQLRKSSGPPTP